MPAFLVTHFSKNNKPLINKNCLCNSQQIYYRLITFITRHKQFNEGLHTHVV